MHGAVSWLLMQRGRLGCWLLTKFLTGPTLKAWDRALLSGIWIYWLHHGGYLHGSHMYLQLSKCERLPHWVTFPLDLVRRRIQLEGAGGRAHVYKTGLFGTFSHIIRTEGLRGLYRGILPEYYKVVPSIGIVFMTYEKMKQLLSDIDWCIGGWHTWRVN